MVLCVASQFYLPCVLVAVFLERTHFHEQLGAVLFPADTCILFHNQAPRMAYATTSSQGASQSISTRLPPITCFKCPKISTRMRGIQCSSCQRWAHVSCVGLKQRQAVELPVWQCINCIHGPQPGNTDADTGIGQTIPASADWGEKLADLKANTPIVQLLPKSVRGALADKLATIITAAVNLSTEDAWWELLTFAFKYLRMPEERSSNKNANLASHIRSLLDQNLPARILPINTQPINTTARSQRQIGDLGKRLRAKCADGDIRAALRLLTSEDTVAAQSEETIRALQAKHPPPPNDITLPEANQDIQPLQVEPDDILAAVKAMPPGSGAGLDGVRPKHLQDMVAKDTFESGRRLVTALSKLANLMLAGGIPQFACGAVFGASLCAL